MSDPLADIRALRAAKYHQDKLKAQQPSEPPKPSTPEGNAVLLQDLNVEVDFLSPDDPRPSTRHSFNPIFPLRVALGQLCSKLHLDVKKARLWKLGSGGGEDRLLDLEKTAGDAAISDIDKLLVEIRRSDGQWTKVAPNDHKDASAQVKSGGNSTTKDVLKSVIGKIATQNSLKRGHNEMGAGPSGYSLRSVGDRDPSDDDDLQRALKISKSEAVADERKFEGVENRLATLGYRIVKMENDGNCLFAAVALQVFGSSADHLELRAMAISHMTELPEKFYPFVSGEFDVYLATMSVPGEFGTHIEIQALADVLQRPFEIYSDVQFEEELTVVGEEFIGIGEPIRVSYHRGNHYNAVVPVK